MMLDLRPAEIRDLNDLLRLYRQLNLADPEADQDAAAAVLSEMIESPIMEVLLALGGSQAVSTCTLLVVPNLTRALSPYAVIENVVTDAAFRGRGAGRAVMNYAIGKAWKAGCYKIMLMTGTQREGTIAFYESLGFRSDSKTAMDLRRPG